MYVCFTIYPSFISQNTNEFYKILCWNSVHFILSHTYPV